MVAVVHVLDAKINAKELVMLAAKEFAMVVHKLVMVVTVHAKDVDIVVQEDVTVANGHAMKHVLVVMVVAKTVLDFAMDVTVV